MTGWPTTRLTAIVTAKTEAGSGEAAHYGFLQFMVDCVVRLERRQEDRISMQTLQITKYRGSGYAAAEFPLSFGPSGIEVGATNPADIGHKASTVRLSAGFERLDAMLGGGVFRGSSTLVTGVPGTSKTTLAGKFIEAACQRGERALFVSFDESARADHAQSLVGRHLSSRTHVKSGLLRMHSARTEGISAEEHLIRINSLIREHRPQCMVIDPLTAIAKSGALGAARTVANRLIYMVKDEEITLMVTALSETDGPGGEATDLQISTIADTWIHLSYLVRSGERNRALTIVKSRGTSHSNQVRELVLSDSRPDAVRRLYRRRRGADGHPALGEGGRRRSPRSFGTARSSTTSAASSSLPRPTPAPRSRRCRWNWIGSVPQLALYSAENDIHTATSSQRESELRIRRGADAAGGSARKRGNGAANESARRQVEGQARSVR